MATKQEIIKEIQRCATENNGQPLGVARFSKETGITSYIWQEHWARFSEALEEAGFSPNQLTVSYSDELMIEKLIGLIRTYRRFPTAGEIRIARKTDSLLPSPSTFDHFGSKHQKAKKIMNYLNGKSGYDDIVSVCSDVLKSVVNSESRENASSGQIVGEVYLFKSGRYYKIGKTNDSVRRGSELRIQLPENLHLIHSIRTDDPSGIETYWHKRYNAKRMNGEWFDLSATDIKAFKAWRKIV